MPRKRLSDFKNFNQEDIVSLVTEEAGIETNDSLIVVARRIADIPDFSCTLNIKEEEGLNEFIAKWTRKFINGFNNRPSVRTSNPIGTQHDPILDEIISARLPNITGDMESIRYGHRLSMSAENIAGSLLEEFIATELLKYQWHCCWGETMRSIDFCHENGKLLQIKNSDNSENSSSKTVRDGTPIEHWFRRFSKTGATNWPALNELVGITDKQNYLSEESFKNFVRKVVSENPGSVFIEEGNPWYGTQNNES